MKTTTTNGSTSLTQSVLPIRNLQVSLMPPLLKARLEYYKAEMPPWAPTYDRILVYPLRDTDMPLKTESGLYLPQDDNTKDQLGSQRGLLVAAGPKALEQLYSHGIALGHLVLCARHSPWGRKYISRERKIIHKVLVLRASEIVASEDLLNAYEKQDLWLEMTPDGRVLVCDREQARERSDPEDNYEST